MTAKWRNVHILCAAAAAAIAATASVASAHPMGNFTVNRYARLEPGASSLGLVYVVDYAEIPTFQELARVPGLGATADPAALDRAPEARGLEAELARTWLAGLNVSADGRRLALQLRASTLAFVAGAGGLPTMRLRLQLDAPWPAGGEALVRYDDTGATGRLGWREVVIRPRADVAILASTLPGTDRSRELTAYPADPNAQLPQETAVELHLSGLRAPVPAGVDAPEPAEPVAPAARQQAPSPAAAAPVRGDRLADLITRDELTPSLVLFSLLIAFALGALHALSPGHGKTIVAAYLVGSRGTARHALLLGGIVTVAHTAGVFLLGLVTLSLSAHVVPEKLYPMIQLLSGAAIAVLGIRMFATRLGDGWRAHSHDASGDHAHHHGDGDAHAHDHPHEHGPGHEHDHGHGHGHHHGYSHALPAGPPSLSTLVALGVSGGILPCPSALVVLLSAVALHRIAAGLVLIVAFSIGLASVLSLIGILVVRAGTVLSRFESAAGIARRIPAFSALCVCLLGLGLAAGAVPDVQRVFF